MNENKAITLIALVITIVILLILAGITITLSIRNDDIFKEAQQATQKYSNSQIKEETEIAKYTNYIDSYINNSREDAKPILLWTNENSDSNFTAQTISMDLSEYKYVIVIIHPWIGGNNYPRTAALLPISDSTNENWGSVTFGATSTSRLRNIKATTSGVTISNETKNGDNNELIPIYIYGIKSDLGIWNTIVGE